MATDVGQTTVLLRHALLVDEDAGSSCVHAVDGATPGVTCSRNQSQMTQAHDTLLQLHDDATQVEVEACARL